MWHADRLDSKASAPQRILHDPVLDFPRIVVCLFAAVYAVGLCSCSMRDTDHKILVSAKEQRMIVYKKENPVASYKVSTSKFGLGDRPRSNCTPVGKMEIVQKIGHRAPLGMVFKHRRPTGEILRPNAPGRDPIVTRILRLRGKEPSTRNAYGRYIYIHGTPEEYKIGKRASFGCIRMKSKDIKKLFDRVGVGAEVEVTTGRLPTRDKLALRTGGLLNSLKFVPGLGGS